MSLTPTLPSVPPDVTAFAASHGVAQPVSLVLEITRRVFPSAGLELHLEAEDVEDRHILVEVDVSGLDDARVGAAPTEWTDEMFRSCPATHVCLFRLALV